MAGCPLPLGLHVGQWCISIASGIAKITTLIFQDLKILSICKFEMSFPKVFSTHSIFLMKCIAGKWKEPTPKELPWIFKKLGSP